MNEFDCTEGINSSMVTLSAAIGIFSFIIFCAHTLNEELYNYVAHNELGIHSMHIFKAIVSSILD